MSGVLRFMSHASHSMCGCASCFRAYREEEALSQQPAAESHCATCSCAPGMTPSVRFDTTPAEKEGAVRDHLIRMGWTPPAEVPVGAEDRARHLLAAALRPHDRMASDWAMEPTFDGYAVAQRDALHAIAAALAQQPAAVSEEMVERATMALLGKSHDTAPGIDWRCDRAWTVNKVRKHMRAALTAALARCRGGGS